MKNLFIILLLVITSCAFGQSDIYLLKVDSIYASYNDQLVKQYPESFLGVYNSYEEDIVFFTNPLTSYRIYNTVSSFENTSGLSWYTNAYNSTRNSPFRYEKCDIKFNWYSPEYEIMDIMVLYKGSSITYSTVVIHTFDAPRINPWRKE